jgi:hypothetical protein
MHIQKFKKTINIINIDQIISLEKALINLTNQQVMKIFTNHDYTVSQSLDYHTKTKF